uniref:Disease resistance RPP13-like protein 1 n=1 Tax=Vitis vinifera TaxID=29760 RepID=F6HVD2_VITVI
MADFVGEAILSGFIQKLIDMVNPPELWNFASEGHVHSELNKWKKILMKIYAVLHDAEEKQMTDPLVKMWLDELGDLAYDVEDILDGFVTQALRRNLMAETHPSGTQPSTSKLRSLIPSCCTSFTPNAIKFNAEMWSKIKKITARLQEISAQKNDLHLRENIAGESSTKTREILPTTSLVDESRVYGRETDKAAIANLLLRDDPCTDEVCVIPVVGMAGIGKTTLAQLAFNDDEIKAHFDLRVWVYVSDDFDVLKITKTILQSVSPNTQDVNDLNLLQMTLREGLSGKKFLLILDDVWNENFDSWDFLCMPMRSGEPGSKLIVTTRNEGVASITRTYRAYRLHELAYKDCLSVFTQQALGKSNFDAHSHLKEVGEEIVRRCKGLPLAAKALGGMLRNQVSHDAWENILTSKIWDLPEDKSQVLPALKLSYHHLPSHLKKCFAYCSIFPKGYEFDKDELIQLWMAEGFFQQTKENTRPEDLGSKYFYDLLSRIRELENLQDLRGKLSISGLHNVVNSQDAMHAKLEEKHNIEELTMEWDSDYDKPRNEMNEMNVLAGLRPPTNLKKLTVAYYGGSTFLGWIRDPSFPSMTQLILKNCQRCTSLPSLGKLSFLKTLHIKGMSEIRTIDVEFYGGVVQPFPSLEFLKFENMPKWEDWFFPDAVEGVELFPRLRELTIRNCSKLVKQLPDCLPSLVKLDISKCRNLAVPFSRFASLGELNIEECKDMVLRSGVVADSRDQLTSRWVCSGLESAVIGRCDWLVSLDDQRLPSHLKMLKIADCVNLKSLQNGLQNLTCLEELEMMGCLAVESFPETGLPPMLRRLVLQKCRSLRSLPHNYSSCPLESLEIRCCPSLICFPHGGLPSTLKQLMVADCIRLKYLPDGMMHRNSIHSNNDCCLQILRIHDCKSLKFFPRGELPPTLERLEIRHCSNLEPVSEKMWPNNTALEYLELRGYPNLKILPECLHSVKQLKIEDCGGLEGFPERGFSAPNLRELRIWRCENLKCLPHQMKNLTSLRVLSMEDSPGLESFPEGGLAPNLKFLSIINCKNLKTPSKVFYMWWKQNGNRKPFNAILSLFNQGSGLIRIWQVVHRVNKKREREMRHDPFS